MPNFQPDVLNPCSYMRVFTVISHILGQVKKKKSNYIASSSQVLNIPSLFHLLAASAFSGLSLFGSETKYKLKCLKLLISGTPNHGQIFEMCNIIVVLLLLTMIALDQ